MLFIVSNDVNKQQISVSDGAITNTALLLGKNLIGWPNVNKICLCEKQLWHLLLSLGGRQKSIAECLLEFIICPEV